MNGRRMRLNIIFTDKAIAKLNQNPKVKEKLIRLKYDIEGCGCVNDGVPALWLVDKQDSDDTIIETNYLPVMMEKSKLFFFDEKMTIDIVEGKNCLQLRSPNQIINPRLMVVEVSEEADGF
jgi:uncharacterized protein YqkB